MQQRQITQIVTDWLPGFIEWAVPYLYVWFNPLTHDLIPRAARWAFGGFLARSLTSRRVTGYLRVSLSLALLSAIAAFAAMAQPASKPLSRTLSIGGVGQEPKFTLDISAEGQFGTVVVSDGHGSCCRSGRDSTQ
jgi:hypothetical protein